MQSRSSRRRTAPRRRRPDTGRRPGERDPGHGGAPRRARFTRDDLRAVVVGVVRAGDRARLVEVLADVQVCAVVAGLAPLALVAGPAEVLDVIEPGTERIHQAVDLLPGIPADITRPDLVRAGAHVDAEGVSEAVGDDPARVRIRARGERVVGQAAPVTGLTRMIAPSRETGSPLVRRSWLRSAPPSAVGGLRTEPTVPGGSPHGLSGLPSWP